MRVTKVWMEAKRRFPKQGFNDWGEAGCGVSVELDTEDLPHLDSILHSMWKQLTDNIRTELINLRVIGLEDQNLPATYLGLAEPVQQMIRPAQASTPDVSRALAEFLRTRQQVVGQEVFAGVEDSE